MKELIKIAWRNIWRNKRRTLLTTASIFLALSLSLFTRSMQKGSYANMIENAVKLTTGYFQVQAKEYWENKSINNTFINSPELFSEIQSIKNVKTIIPRLESFALASSGNHTKGTIVIATNPETENALNKLSEKIIEGEYFSGNENKIIVAEKLAQFLGVNVGDTLVLLGQGFHGITAAAQYKIKGIFKFPMPQLNNQLIYMPLSTGQNFYGAENRVTTYSILISEQDKLKETIEKVTKKLSDKYVIMDWEKLNTEMVQAIQSDNVGGIIMLAILYMVIGFGMFGTVMMMTMERRKEFAIMIAVGMQRGKLFLVVMLETIMIGIIVIIVSLIVMYPVLYYFHNNPIPLSGNLAAAMEIFGAEPVIPFSLKYHLFINQIMAVVVIAFIATLYPLSKILRFNILQAMRS